MRSVTTMVFTTPSSKNLQPSLWAWLLVAALLCLAPGYARAAEAATGAPEPGNTPALTLERAEGKLLLSARFQFDLPAVVEDALYKGIPIYFVAQADLLRDRWYWANKTITTTQRRMRLSYHPLTRRWRLNMGSGDLAEAAQGLTFGQNFDSLGEAMAAVRRVSRWKIADEQDLKPERKHIVEFSFELDTSQLPRPLQIGTLGQSDWLIDVKLSQEMDMEPSR